MTHLWKDRDWFRRVTGQLSPSYDGVWLQCPLYVGSKADGHDTTINALYTEKSKNGVIRRTALLPFLTDTYGDWGDVIDSSYREDYLLPLPDVDEENQLHSTLTHFERVLGISASVSERLKQYPKLCKVQEMGRDFIYDVEGFRTMSGKDNRLVREGCNKFRSDGGSCRPYQREDRTQCLALFEKWKAWYRERFGTGFQYQISSSRYVKAALQSSVEDFPGVSIIVAEHDGRIIGFNIQWFYREQSVCLARVHDNSIRGLYAALLHFPSAAMPDSVKIWNDGCGDGDKGSLTEHKRRLKPMEERTYYTAYSKIAKPIKAGDPDMRLF